ncbi:MAG TPA: site-specific DNA-methyltransferase [Smithellaceae bacterium]|jgi:adenine-specific DNA-methyltransferase|nr:site-specific DNA-methyltransferase [Smithellaceae bacterium]HOG82832.1 site-specific DNA-methyltransferase [Smithellaceae bacterium]HPC09024.1 site-specific DNA-methyltransferase [Smithella sp.]HPN87427.1 site-specific DNA-methyltransferase [Smithella sp.]HQL98629.1 site-specific DNA-methyltransferase [Smithella sp.]
MNKKQKLELTWIGKENRPRLEPRILLEEPKKSYHALHRVSGKDIFDNQLIFGDNLLALKALESEYAGKVKCVFIDPPYNTGSAFTHYDDGVEHSIWLSLMRDRLEIIRRLLSENGSLWITIDDNEAHYLKVLCDEVFGRGNFMTNVVWQKRTSPDNRLRLGDAHDSILVFRKNKFSGNESFNQLPVTDCRTKDFKNPDNDPRGPWASTDFTGMTGHATPNQFYTITSPNGTMHPPPDGRCWALSEETFKKYLAENRVWFGKDGKARPRLKRFLNELEGQNSWSWWPNTEVGHNQEAKKEVVALFGANSTFDTPKPERLLQRVLTIATNPGDLVLDSFAGSGTTGAVAHKMGRRWIMVELGDHCHTHIIPRLKKVIDGEDSGGITKAVKWKGGGGFRYYRLAPSLLEKDKWGNWVINKTYNAAMLAEALCKLEGFTYAPSDTVYWQHGYSTERDFLYVTTANLTHQQLLQLSDEVGPDRALLVLCTAFRGKGEYPNLTVKKIPRQVLSRCEWGHDDYSLQVENLPQAPPKAGQQSLFTEEES